MAKLMVEAELPSRAGDERLSPDELLKVSIFDGLKVANLERYPGALVLRRYEAGEVVCRQGEAGWTAFYIVTSEDMVRLREAQADRAAASELKALKADVARLGGAGVDEAAKLRARAIVSLAVHRQGFERPRGGGALDRLLGRWFSSDAQASSGPQFIPIDGPVDLRYDNPVATLHEGELFGEMSCINRYPRSATVRVSHDCYMLEMLRNVLEVLQKNKAFKDQMDAVYRRRVLGAHLRSLPIFSDLPEDALAELHQRVQLIEKEAGEVIFKEGDPSDSVYVIRIGMVKVVQRTPGGERVLAYRGRGEYIGETGLVRKQPRNATCTALDHPLGDGDKKRRPGRVELVRIDAADFGALLEKFPPLREKVAAIVAERTQPTELSVSAGWSGVSGRLDELGLLQGQKLMLIDLERCTRCDECVRGCANTHADGRTRLLREGPRFGKYLVPATCRQCLDPVCMIGCPVGSIHKGAGGEIVIEDWCIGCEICAKQCPYSAINMHPLPLRAAETESLTVDVTQRAVVCDQCNSLRDGIPSCVYACPHDAALRVDARAFFAGQTDGAR
jgi:CRP-like cAMP-binding protein/Fe-S-cluster-containing dehydrogenase component